jgi:hypothetical protein
MEKKTWRDSAPIDMFLSAVSVLVVVQLSSEVPEGLRNNPVYNIPMLPMCLVMYCLTLNRHYDSLMHQEVFIHWHIVMSEKT